MGDVVTTDVVTTDVVTTDVVTTDAVTMDVVTTDAVTMDVVTTEAVTTDVVTTDAVTMDAVTMDVVTTDVVTMEAAIGTTYGRNLKTCRRTSRLFSISAALPMCFMVAAMAVQEVFLSVRSPLLLQNLKCAVLTLVEGRAVSLACAQV